MQPATMLVKHRDRRIAALLALSGLVIPGLHKFYLRQVRWGIVYILLSWTVVPRVASLMEGIWYLMLDRHEFDRRFNVLPSASPSAVPPAPPDPLTASQQAEAIATALRQWDQLRQDGLISEAEFEHKRRQLLHQFGDAMGMAADRQSTEEMRQAVKSKPSTIGIDVNRATVDDWLRLPGISIHQARSLVSLAQAGVQFHCLDDLAAALSLPLQRLQPLAPLLQFCYYEPELIDLSQPLNPNTASVEQLSRLPGIDRSLAEAIVQQRLLQGHYSNLVAFQQRLELSGEQVTQIMYYLRF